MALLAAVMHCAAALLILKRLNWWFIVQDKQLETLNTLTATSSLVLFGGVISALNDVYLYVEVYLCFIFVRM